MAQSGVLKSSRRLVFRHTSSYPGTLKVGRQRNCPGIIKSPDNRGCHGTVVVVR